MARKADKRQQKTDKKTQKGASYMKERTEAEKKQERAGIAGIAAGAKKPEQAEELGKELTESGCCHAHRTKERSEKESKDLINRLNRIEGQIRGIRGMVERDAYCPDILVQVAAANAALNSFNKVLLANHIKTCVTNDILEGKEETVDELVAVLQKLMK